MAIYICTIPDVFVRKVRKFLPPSVGPFLVLQRTSALNYLLALPPEFMQLGEENIALKQKGFTTRTLFSFREEAESCSEQSHA